MSEHPAQPLPLGLEQSGNSPKLRPSLNRQGDDDSLSQAGHGQVPTKTDRAVDKRDRFVVKAVNGQFQVPSFGQLKRPTPLGAQALVGLVRPPL